MVYCVTNIYFSNVLIADGFICFDLQNARRNRILFDGSEILRRSKRWKVIMHSVAAIARYFGKIGPKLKSKTGDGYRVGDDAAFVDTDEG